MQLIAVKYQGRKRYRDRTPLRNEWEPGDAKRVPTGNGDARFPAWGMIPDQ